MLTKIEIENFRSFDEKVELNMISSSKIRIKAEHRVSTKRGLKLLKHAAIYGANAAGKSNLVNAISFIKAAVEGGLPPNSSMSFCRNRKENMNRDTLFELQLELNGKVYAYGFSCRLSEHRITGEWLYELHIQGSSTCIFERLENSKPELGERITLSEDEKSRFNTYASDFVDNKTELFLSEMNRGKKFAEDSRLQVFREVFQWIREQIVIITPSSRLVNFQQYYNDESLAEINRMIQTFDTGISDVRVQEIEMNDLKQALPEYFYDKINESIIKKSIEAPNKPVRLSGRTDTFFFSIELSSRSIVRVTTIKLRHVDASFDFGFEDESDGTRRLFDLMDMLFKKDEDTVFFVDELERSLHPKLTEHFLELFGEYQVNRRVQLIFTTHESSIMDQKLFRRDEIWFVERDNDNSSRVYSLDRFKERYDRKLSKAYLEGRYGAIPVFRKFVFAEDD